MRRIIVIGVLVIIVLLLIVQFGPSVVRGETVRLASPIFGVATERLVSPHRIDNETRI